MKYAQAVITKRNDGTWKITIQSEHRVERMVTGTIETVLQELKIVSKLAWEERIPFG